MLALSSMVSLRIHIVPRGGPNPREWWRDLQETELMSLWTGNIPVDYVVLVVPGTDLPEMTNDTAPEPDAGSESGGIIPE
jgi:hypothetical protein